MAAPHMMAMTAETNARRRSHFHRDSELLDGATKHHIGHAGPSLTNPDADSHARQVTAGAKSGTLTWTALKHVVSPESLQPWSLNECDTVLLIMRIQSTGGQCRERESDCS